VRGPSGPVKWPERTMVGVGRRSYGDRVQRLRSSSPRSRRRRPSVLAVEAYADPVPTDRYAELGVHPPVAAGVRAIVTPTSPARTLAAAG
jgi:hypothetical protein